MSTARKGAVTAAKITEVREALSRLMPTASIAEVAIRTGLSEAQVAMVRTDRAGNPTIRQLEAWLQGQGVLP